MKIIEVSNENWKRIVQIRREYKLRNNNQVIDQLLLCMDDLMKLESEVK